MQVSVELKSLEGIQFVNPQQISKHLYCPICISAYYYPVRLSCGHTFCRRCLDMMKSTNQFNCPECRSQFDFYDTPQDRLAHNIIQEQLVFCLNKTNLCSWRGQLRDLESHLNFCSFKQIDEECRSVVESIEQKVQQRIIGSDLNTKSSFLTHIDENLQANINQNLGESLLVRLLNKDKIMATKIIHSISQKNYLQTISSDRMKICINEDSIKNHQEVENEIQDKLVNSTDEQDQYLNLFSDCEYQYEKEDDDEEEEELVEGQEDQKTEILEEEYEVEDEELVLKQQEEVEEEEQQQEIVEEQEQLVHQEAEQQQEIEEETATPSTQKKDVMNDIQDQENKSEVLVKKKRIYKKRQPKVQNKPEISIERYLPKPKKPLQKKPKKYFPKRKYYYRKYFNYYNQKRYNSGYGNYGYYYNNYYSGYGGSGYHYMH